MALRLRSCGPAVRGSHPAVGRRVGPDAFGIGRDGTTAGTEADPCLTVHYDGYPAGCEQHPSHMAISRVAVTT